MHRYYDDMVRWRRDLHQIPELGLKLEKTVKYVSSVLDNLEISYKYLIDGNAIVAEINGNNEKICSSKKVIALRADMDGLPVKEDTGLSFASKNGNMHACGHDGHTAMLLGAAKYLKSIENTINGTVKLLFQPGEESPGGAEPMIKEGALKNPDVDVIFGLHEGNIANFDKKGAILFRKGNLMAAAHTFDIKIRGRGTHAGYPQNGVDPIVAASHLILAFQNILSRNVSASEEAVLSITYINGGTTYNVIPEEVHLKGTLRVFDKELEKMILLKMDDICRGIGLSTSTEIELHFQHGYPATVNDEQFTEFAYDLASKLYPEDAIYLNHPVMGAEDMSYYLNEVPGTYAFLVNPKAVEGKFYPHHHPKFDVDEEYFIKGANLLVNVALEYLKNDGKN